MWAVVIVAVALAGAIWLQDSQQFPWILFVALTFPALAIVVAAGGGPHAVSGSLTSEGVWNDGNPAAIARH
jgi:hypothetical protein